MTSKIYVSLLILFLVISFSSSAQDDYIILEDGSQTYGAVQYDSIKGIVYFKPSTLDIYSEYEKSQIKEFKNEKIVYHKKPYEGNETFVLRLADGDTRLYTIWNDFLVETEDKLVTLKYRDHFEGLRDVFGERCNWDFNEEYFRYSEAYLTQLVKGYNKKDCFKAQKPHFGLRASYGVANSSLFISTENVDVDFDDMNIFFIGFKAEFPTYKNSSLIASLDFTSQKESVPFDVSNFSSAGVEVSQFLLNLGPRYYIGNFFFGGGVTLAYNFSNNSFVTTSQNFVDVTLPIEVKGVGLGYHANVGYRLLNEINRSLSIEIENNLWRGSDLTTSSINFGLFVGI